MYATLEVFQMLAASKSEKRSCVGRVGAYLGAPGFCTWVRALADTSRRASSREVHALVLMAAVLSNSWLAAVERMARSLERVVWPCEDVDTSCNTPPP